MVHGRTYKQKAHKFDYFKHIDKEATISNQKRVSIQCQLIFEADDMVATNSKLFELKINIRTQYALHLGNEAINNHIRVIIMTA